MKVFSTAFVWVLTGVLCCSATGEETPAKAPFVVHGRMWIQRNGTVAPRIWIVGTKRILGVAQDTKTELPLMPSALGELTWDTFVFADFTVIPLAKDEEGVMRMVRVVCAENIVVTDWDLKFLRRIPSKIEEEKPNPSPEPTAPSGRGSP
jgi:hypothetical protein